eukprot:TRINITY_DN67012_c1_g1_i1.p1 TRINITY_DN67012_c1_g1~~TRINITY_DN67012_c1_g1_i1.p1  ORF type:complete len:145 (-),score=4.52 TRINITY_DN67012_c1_g1_i1:459-893(-)
MNKLLLLSLGLVFIGVCNAIKCRVGTCACWSISCREEPNCQGNCFAYVWRDDNDIWQDWEYGCLPPGENATYTTPVDTGSERLQLKCGQTLPLEDGRHQLRCCGDDGEEACNDCQFGSEESGSSRPYLSVVTLLACLVAALCIW